MLFGRQSAGRDRTVVGWLRIHLLHPKAIIAVMLFAGIAMMVGLVVPQSPVVSQNPAVELLGLNRVFTMWWLEVIAAIASLQLFAATVIMIRRDFRRLTREIGPASAYRFSVASPEDLSSALSQLGYVRLRKSTKTTRFVCHPWGLVGPSLLHFGMCVTVVSVLLVALTNSSGLMEFFEGEPPMPEGTPLEVPQQGLLADPPVLPGDFGLRELQITYWENGQPRTIIGDYSLTVDGRQTLVELVVNEPRMIDGVRYFQEHRVGYAFALTVTAGEEATLHRLDMPLPPSQKEPSYLDTDLGNGDLLQAKVYHDPQVPGGSPELVLRLKRAGQVIGQQSFAQTSHAMVGDIDVRIDAMRRFSTVSFDRSIGYEPMFFSFVVIFIGSLLVYLTPSREITLIKHEDGTVVAYWHAARFANLYIEEYNKLQTAAEAKESV
ncbi:MAG: hypothetical protein KGZ89_00370 [Actinobacteria bacterium]|nr:hypothetical protein [Actinomycetota bacterium]